MSLPGDSTATPPTTQPPESMPVLLLLAAFAAGLAAQGGYYPLGRWLVAAVTLAAVIAAVAVRRWSWADAWPVPVACAGLGLWAVMRAASVGSAGLCVPIVVGLGCLAGAVVVLRRTGEAQRELGAAAVVAVGVLLGVAGWLGVAWHRRPWGAVFEAHLWRAAGPLTYANAQAAVLAALSLLALGFVLTRPDSTTRLLAAYLSLVGLGATVSRGGLLALSVGLLVLGWRAGVRACAPIVAVLLGTVVAIAGLAPSMPATAAAQPVPALVGLVLGGALAAGLTRLPTRRRVLALPSAAVLAGIGLFAAATSSPTGQIVTAARFTLSSPGRTLAARQALHMFAAHPLIGVGPDRARFLWTGSTGQLLVARYAHNEYLQLLVELGAVGLALLLLLLFATVRTIHSAPHHHCRLLRAGVLAALTALTVHSAFDFLWHLTVIPLGLGLLIGLAAPTTGPVRTPAPTAIHPPTIKGQT